MNLAHKLKPGKRWGVGKIPASKRSTSVLNFIRIGCPTTTLIHMPLSLGRVRKVARQDMSKSNLSLREMIQETSRSVSPVRTLNPEVVAIINSVKFPRKQVLKDCKLSRRFFTLSEEEPTKANEIEWSLSTELRRKRPAVLPKKILKRENSEYDSFKIKIAEISKLSTDLGRSTKILSKSIDRIENTTSGSFEFFKALRVRNIPLIRNMIGLKPNLLKSKDYLGQTALHWAAKRGDIELVKILIEGGASLHSVDLMNRSALSLATRYNKDRVAEFLQECEQKHKNQTKQNPHDSNMFSSIFTELARKPSAEDKE